MDTKRVPFSPAYERQLLDFLKAKYKGTPIDLVLISDNNAFDFMRRHGDSLFPGAPVVFCGINFFTDALLDGHPNYTGITEIFDARSTLEAALAIHPETRHVYVINDHLPSGRIVTDDARQQLTGAFPGVAVEYAPALSMADLERRLKALPAHSLVLLGAFFRDSDEVFYSSEEVVRRITAATGAPLYGQLDTHFGLGIIGGMLIDGRSQGQLAGRIAVEILNGRDVADIPVIRSGANSFMFDRVHMDRFGVDPARLPLGSTQINQNMALLTPKEREWLREHANIRLAPNPDAPPIEFFHNTGAYRGLAADYIALLEKKLEIRFQIQRPANWTEAVAMARERSIDLWAAASPTPQRDEFMLFTQPIIEAPTVIIARRATRDRVGIGDLAGKRITVVADSPAHEQILNSHPGGDLQAVPDIGSALRKVSFGEADYLQSDLATASYFMEREGITNLMVVGESQHRHRWSLAVRKDWPILRDILVKGLHMITEAERRAIMDKWVRFAAPGRPWWQLTRQQQIALGGAMALTLFLIFMAWTTRLRALVHARTRDLAAANRMLGESEEKYRTIFERAEDPMWIISGDHFTLANKAAARLLKYAGPEALVDTPPWRLSPELQPDGLHSQEKTLEMIQVAMQHGYHRFEWHHLKRDGTVFPVEVSLTRIPYEGEQAIFCVWNDISERKQAEEEIRRLATHDALTGLASLRLAEDRMEVMIAKASRDDTKAAVLFIDLDRFKDVNDTHGHDAGDVVLRETATCLEGLMRKTDTVARIGGDEFLVIMDRVEGREVLGAVADKIIRVVRHPIGLGREGLKVRVGVSIGISLFPDHGRNREELVKRADSAMYEAKHEGRSGYRIAS
ncbi:MAG: diguanylate cyclase [Candidatus Sedimenticola endophacoides]